MVNKEGESVVKKNCLVGFTGYVGSTLLAQTTFDELYNSSNIESIKGMEYDLVVCAAAPAVKWKANQAPEEDLANINQLISCLKEVKAQKFVLISTVDVYSTPIKVDESANIQTETAEPYGKHRFYLEQFVTKTFHDHLIIRLPGLFGKGLKKNFIYDLIHDNALHLTHHLSEFQFYNMNHLWDDIQIALDNSLSIVNFATEPVSAKEIARAGLNINFSNETEKKPVLYDMRSLYSHIFSDRDNKEYMKSKKEVLQEIKAFIEEEKRAL
nr:NAD-dependent epimerase/dehydratase family protein [Paenibacillus sp. PvR133]